MGGELTLLDLAKIFLSPSTSKGGVALGITTNAGYASAPYNSIRIAMALLAAYGVIL